MSKSYKVVKKIMNMGEKKGQTVYSVRPVSYGILTSDEVSKQISAESTATPGDVKAVLDRYAYYVKENLKKGYSIELLGFGTLYLRFLTGKAVSEEKKANASLVKSIVPAFRPSFTMLEALYKEMNRQLEAAKKKPTSSNGETPSEGEDNKPNNPSGGSDGNGGSSNTGGSEDSGDKGNTGAGSGNTDQGSTEGSGDGNTDSMD